LLYPCSIISTVYAHLYTCCIYYIHCIPALYICTVYPSIYYLHCIPAIYFIIFAQCISALYSVQISKLIVYCVHYLHWILLYIYVHCRPITIGAITAHYSIYSVSMLYICTLYEPVSVLYALSILYFCSIYISMLYSRSLFYRHCIPAGLVYILSTRSSCSMYYLCCISALYITYTVSLHYYR